VEDFIRTYIIDEDVVDGLLSFKSDHENTSYEGVTAKGLNRNTKDSMDIGVQIEDSDPRIRAYNKELTDCLEQYKNEFLEDGFPGMYLTGSFNIQTYLPTGGFKKWHCERGSSSTMTRCFVYMTYLNDVHNGGHTEFFYQQVKIQPKKGLTVIWPSDFTHTHRGVPAPNETKIIATGWVHLV
jgi:hypothetical protein